MGNFSTDQLIGFYTRMLRIRMVEQAVSDVFSKGEIPGFIHVCIGQEATPVAVCSQLNDSDYVATTHRGHGHALGKGIDLKLFMAELYGKSNGFCRGRSGSMHVADSKLGILGANGIVGGGIPLAVGAAFAAQYKKTGQVAVSFFGEGATDEGAFHESVNISAVKKLPIVFVCENNGWSQFTPQSVHMPIKEIAKRAASYDIPGVSAPNDFPKIYEAAGKAIERARSGEGPTILEVIGKRWYGHYVGDQQKYRPAEDVEAARNLDCVLNFEKRLLKDKVIKKQGLKEIEESIAAEIEEALEFARQSPMPEPSELMTDLYV